MVAVVVSSRVASDALDLLCVSIFVLFVESLIFLLFGVSIV